MQGEWTGELRCRERIGGFLVQTPLGPRPGVRTQSRNEAPGVIRVKI